MATFALAISGGGYSVAVRGIAEIIVWWIVGVGLIARWWPVSPLPRTAIIAGLGLAGLMGLTALSMLWVENDARILEEVVRVAGYLGLFALVVLSSSRGQARPWLVGLAIGLVVVAVLGVISRAEPGPFPEQELLATLTGSAARLSYPLNYWNAMGAVMAAAIVLLVHLGAASRDWRWSAAAVAAIPVTALALFMTSSRGGVVSAVLGLVVLFAASRQRWSLLANALVAAPGTAIVIGLTMASPELLDGRLDTSQASSQGDVLMVVLVLVTAATAALRWAVQRWIGRAEHVRLAPRTTRIALGAAALVAVAALLAAGPGQLIDDFTAKPSQTDFSADGFVRDHLSSSSGTGRYQYWQAAFEAFGDEPITGIGPGRYADYWLQHGSLAAHIRDAHSLPIEVLAELGLIGFALLLTFLVPPLLQAWRSRRSETWLAGGGAAVLAITAAGLFNASIDWMWEVPSAFALPVIGLGLLAGPALRRPDDPTPGSGNYALGAVTVAVGWVAVCASVVVLLTDAQLDRSRDAVARGDLDGALNRARQAQMVQPWASAPRLQRALVLERMRQYPSARLALEQAIERAPSDWRLWVVAARLERALGNEQSALAALQRARQLNPDSVLFRQGGTGG